MDVWLWSDIHSDSDPYYKYMLLYTYDWLHVSDNGEIVLMDMDKYLPLKPW